VNEKVARLPPAWLVTPMLRVRGGLARMYRGIVPPAVRVLEGTFGLMETKALYTATELGIADELDAGPRSSEELATALAADADAIGRLLRLLVSLGYFTRNGDGTWSNNAASNLLRRDDPSTLRSWVRFIGGSWSWDIWNELPHSARTGRSGTEIARGGEFFEFVARDRDAAQLFDAAMADVSRHTAPLVAAGYDFSAVRRVCDVGGGTGSVIAGILARHPHLKGVLLDLPDVVAGAPAVMEAAGVADRCELVGGSFFEAVPEGCDRYLLQSIVHDWDDDSAVRILERVRAAMPPDGRVVLLEAVLPDNDTLHPAKYADVMMLVLTGRGRERTRDEYAALAQRAGLRLDRIVDLVLRQGIELLPA
jgi:hypothetical protein